MTTEKIQLEADEQILLQVRKHWFMLCIQVCSVLFLALLPLALGFIVFDYISLPFVSSINTGLIVTLYTAWLIVMWMMLFSIWTNYYLDMWVVTNKRLIAIDQQGFFARTIASFRLERMQDIKVTVNGIVATFLDFGTLEIQTAGEQENFNVAGIPSPSDIKSTILSSADALIAHTTPAAKTGL